ncbi:MAG: symmetrical bis(5'-nucleosyl)-tetraphosphatase [Alysiella sp.]|uniref:symmetrical bis(5'-nucleosyl)-tetraphosphatase n=1 Tax=Alysiella sp. TaxID=1872483 RepID=UPI0026DC307A|nr:symmetrical bis(5'-nucleosyl)-tetraphosphatase [Alysiella sp.]MDO4433479.1 symmetrical bis(5'-nucleosyl)-tetraphosphatase [Alysiella sp.]
MAHYAIGDLQGCFDELSALLAQIGFNHGSDTLWLVGDIVNRGPQSLACLQFVMQHESSVQMVLGNHDLHLLAVLYGFGKQKKQDTLSEIVLHPDMPQMRDWLRVQPLMCHTEQHVLVHAGLLPEWTVAQAQDLADEVAAVLSGSRPQDYFAQMYGNKPDKWSPKLKGADRLRFATNVFTRMRTLFADNSMDFDYKATLGQMPPALHAWFDSENRQNLSHMIVFGHWSALGFVQRNHVLALDTGALWGGELTAVNLDTGERFRQPSFQKKQGFVD